MDKLNMKIKVAKVGMNSVISFGEIETQHEVIDGVLRDLQNFQWNNHGKGFTSLKEINEFFGKTISYSKLEFEEVANPLGFKKSDLEEGDFVKIKDGRWLRVTKNKAKSIVANEIMLILRDEDGNYIVNTEKYDDDLNYNGLTYNGLTLGIYDIVEVRKSENPPVNFSKSDLQDGMIVEIRQGTRYIKMDSMLVSQHGGGIHLSCINDKLEYESDSRIDIVAIYKSMNPLSLQVMFNDLYLNPIWTREEPKKMTLEEVEKELGYKIELEVK